MCLSKVFVDRDGQRELVMEEVASVDAGDGTLVLRTVFGEERRIDGRIRGIDLLSHSIVLEGEEVA